MLRKRLQDLQSVLRRYQIELGNGEGHIRLPLSMDGSGRLLPEMHSYISDPEKKVSDLSLVDLA